MRLAGRLGQFRGEAKLTTWLHRMTVNICRDEQRRRQRAQRLAVEPQPENLRAPILLRFFEGLSYEEIAR